MLKRFDDSELMKEIRGSDSEYFIMLDGTVYKRAFGKCESRIGLNSDIEVRCKFLGILDWHRLVDLIAVHFKYFEHLTTDELLVVRGYICPVKGAGLNHPKYIGYRFADGRLACRDHPGFYYIPGCPTHAISASGELINAKKGTVLKWYITKPSKTKNVTGGYAFNRIDFGRESIMISRHRSMLLVFKPYPDEVDSLVSNHINGIPGDDRLDNLEWVCRKGNIDHAYQNGLRSQNKPVLARNIVTGEITEFYSVAECGRKIGILDKTLNHRLEKGLFCSPGTSNYQVKYLDDPRDWVDPKSFNKKKSPRSESCEANLSKLLELH